MCVRVYLQSLFYGLLSLSQGSKQSPCLRYVTEGRHYFARGSRGMMSQTTPPTPPPTPATRTSPLKSAHAPQSDHLISVGRYLRLFPSPFYPSQGSHLGSLTPGRWSGTSFDAFLVFRLSPSFISAVCPIHIVMASIQAGLCPVCFAVRGSDGWR